MATFANLGVGHFRFRRDDGGESTATWLAAEDAAATGSVVGSVNVPVRLRLKVYSGTTGTASATFPGTLGLKVSHNGGAASAVGSASSYVQGVVSSHLVDGATTTAQLTTDSSYTYASQPGVVNNVAAVSNTLSIPRLDEVSVEWSVLLIANDLADGDTLAFTISATPTPGSGIAVGTLTQLSGIQLTIAKSNLWIVNASDGLIFSDLSVRAMSKVESDSSGFSDSRAVGKPVSSTLGFTEMEKVAAAKVAPDSWNPGDSRTMATTRGVSESPVISDGHAASLSSKRTDALLLAEGGLRGLAKALGQLFLPSDAEALVTAKALTEAAALSDTEKATPSVPRSESFLIGDQEATGAGKNAVDVLTLPESRTSAVALVTSETLGLTQAEKGVVSSKQSDAVLIGDLSHEQTSGAVNVSEMLGVGALRKVTVSRSASDTPNFGDQVAKTPIKAGSDPLVIAEPLRSRQVHSVQAEAYGLTADEKAGMAHLGTESLLYIDARLLAFFAVRLEGLGLSEAQLHAVAKLAVEAVLLADVRSLGKMVADALNDLDSHAIGAAPRVSDLFLVGDSEALGPSKKASDAALVGDQAAKAATSSQGQVLVIGDQAVKRPATVQGQAVSVVEAAVRTMFSVRTEAVGIVDTSQEQTAGRVNASQLLGLGDSLAFGVVTALADALALSEAEREQVGLAINQALGLVDGSVRAVVHALVESFALGNTPIGSVLKALADGLVLSDAEEATALALLMDFLVVADMPAMSIATYLAETYGLTDVQAFGVMEAFRRLLGGRGGSRGLG